jgi:hypothetical protein
VRLFSKGVPMGILLTYLLFSPSILLLCLFSWLFPLFFHFSAAGSGNEAVAKEEGRHQTIVMESAARGQPGLLSTTRPATLGSSVLTDMDAFFWEFDRMSLSSRHAEHFWVFYDAQVDFPQLPSATKGSSVLKNLVGEVWQLLSIS